MNDVVIKAARTADGYCCACDLLPGWVVAYDGDLEALRSMFRRVLTSGSKADVKTVMYTRRCLTVSIDSSTILMWLRCSTTIVAYSRLPLFRR